MSSSTASTVLLSASVQHMSEVDFWALHSSTYVYSMWYYVCLMRSKHHRSMSLTAKAASLQRSRRGSCGSRVFQRHCSALRGGVSSVPCRKRLRLAGRCLQQPMGKEEASCTKRRRRSVWSHPSSGSRPWPHAYISWNWNQEYRGRNFKDWTTWVRFSTE